MCYTCVGVGALSASRRPARCDSDSARAWLAMLLTCKGTYQLQRANKQCWDTCNWERIVSRKVSSQYRWLWALHGLADQVRQGDEVRQQARNSTQCFDASGIKTKGWSVFFRHVREEKCLRVENETCVCGHWPAEVRARLLFKTVFFVTAGRQGDMCIRWGTL